MRDDLRRRREIHLLYVRMGLSYTERTDRLAREYNVNPSAVKKDDQRMDDWVDEVANTGSFAKKAGFLLYQHRAQTEAVEQLARNAQQMRAQSTRRVNDTEEMLTDYRDATPESLGMDPEQYWFALRDFVREMNNAEEDVFKWASEERRNRQEIAHQIRAELDARQSLGEIERVADKLSVEAHAQVEERKVFAGIDLGAFPGIEQARLIGADLDVPLDEPDDSDMTDVPLTGGNGESTPPTDGDDTGGEVE